MQDTDECKKRISEIKAQENLPEPPPLAQTLDLSTQTSVPDAVKLVQRYIEAFQYNYTGKPFIRMNKSRGVSHIHKQTAYQGVVAHSVCRGCILRNDSHFGYE